MKKKLITLSLIFTFIMTSAFGCNSTIVNKNATPKTITLTYWRVYDDQDAFDSIITNYKALHPYVNIVYKKFRFEEFDKELLNALAEDRGPDIFSIPSSRLQEYQAKLAPLPETTSMVYPVTQGTLQKQTVMTVKTVKTLSLKDLKNNFVDLVSNDMVLDKDGQQKIYGLPLFVDTLAMYYNQDLFNNAGISQPPQFWNKEFQQDVKKLTKINSQGNIIQSGAALGGSTNIERSVDILSLLMMQNGSDMMRDGTVSFQSAPLNSTLTYNPGGEALRFYTDFSNPAKEVYCWNNNMPNSLTLFSSNSLAIMFGYAYQLSTIRANNPKLNFSITKMPQIEGNSQQINYSNYWTEVVSNKSKNIDAAWDFVQFETSAQQAPSYLKVAKKPTALRALINSQLDDQDVGTFASEVLTAKSWYQGKDSLTAEKAFQEMIDLTVKNELPIEQIIEQAAAKVQQTIN